MTTKRRELINALITGLKIEEDIFAIDTVKEKTESLNESQYLDFYQAVMKDESFGNGIKSVIKVAEQFKPQTKDNSLQLKAKELIQWCESANSTVFDNATKSGRTFDDELKGTKFTSISDNDLYVLNQVKPYSYHKNLIGNIRVYQTSEEAVKAFMDALKYAPLDAIQIANPLNKLQIKRGQDE